MSTSSRGHKDNSNSTAQAAPAQQPEAGGAKAVPLENMAAYDENRLWRLPPWGDTYWCDMCSTCMRWRHSQRAGGRVCVTAFNFNFPLVIIEQGRCNEYRPVPGAEGLWTEEYVEEEDEYAPRHRDPEDRGYDDDLDGRRRGPSPGGGGGGHNMARRRPRRRPRRGGGGGGGGGNMGAG